MLKSFEDRVIPVLRYLEHLSNSDQWEQPLKPWINFTLNDVLPMLRGYL